MNFDEKARQIKEYVKTDRTDYVEFLNSLEEEKVDWVQNSKEKQEYQENHSLPDYETKWLDNDIYGQIVGEPHLQELDFVKFSYQVMKEEIEEEHTKETLRAISNAPENDQRKSLRIYLFDCLQKPSSPYFNIEAYHRIRNIMYEEKKTVEEVIKEEGYEILSQNFDAFIFQSPKSTAAQIKVKCNNKLGYGEVDLTTYQSAICFYNIAQFMHENGEWKQTMTNGTGEYDEVKKAIVNHLRDLDFNSAHKEVSKAMAQRDLNEDTLIGYNAKLNEIKSRLDLNGN